MFKPRDKKNRLNYGSLLKPPKGFMLEKAVATSFSLDFNALTAAVFALGLGGDTDTELIDNPAMCLRSLKTVTDKLVVFSEAGQIKKPLKDNPLYALLSQTVSTVTLSGKDGADLFPSFHSKVWVIEYANKIEKRYRLLVMSRNLTFDRSYDACVVLDGIVGEKQDEKIKVKPLVDFLEFLKDTINIDAPYAEAKSKIVKSLADTLKDISFTIDESIDFFQEFDLFPLGIPKAKKMLGTAFDMADFHELVIMSPFLSESIIKLFSKPNASMDESKRKRTLITRTTELYKIKDCELDKWDVWVMKDEVVNGEQNAGEDENIGKQDIHAKIYMRNSNNYGTLYLGSANASYSAFNRNVEFVVGLKSYYKCSKVYTPEQFLRDLTGDEDVAECPFRKIDKSEILMADQDIVVDEEEKKLELLIKRFCRANITATVTEMNGTYNIEIVVDKKDIIDDFTWLTIAPLGEEQKETQITNHIKFENVELLHLSEFYTLTARIRTEILARVIMIPTVNIPHDEVETKIVNKVISDVNAFNEYLNAILSDNVLTDYLSRRLERGISSDTGSQQAGTALYEQLLYAAAHHPERFKEIAYIKDILSDDGIITDEFKLIFRTFEEAIKNTRKKNGDNI